MNKKVLITGIAGFVGSHLMEHILVNTDWDIIGIASWKHKGTPENVMQCGHYHEHKDKVTIITHDLSAPFTPSLIKSLQDIDYVFNLASDSHVQRSIEDPVPFMENNISLCINMLELARQIKPSLFLQFSTDEVYGSAPNGILFKEWSTMLPSNPYSASKVAQEAIAISYWRTYGVPVVITNCMNIFGERQDKEKYVSKVIDCIKNDEVLTVHGSEGNIGTRFYLHARNIADAVLFIANNVIPNSFMNGHVDRPDKFNISGEVELDNLTLAELIAKMMGKHLNYQLVEFHATRPGHDRRYALDGTKLTECGWIQPVNFEESLQKTIDWMLNN